MRRQATIKIKIKGGREPEVEVHVYSNLRVEAARLMKDQAFFEYMKAEKIQVGKELVGLWDLYQYVKKHLDDYLPIGNEKAKVIINMRE